MNTFSMFKHVPMMSDVENQLVDAGVELTKLFADAKNSKTSLTTAERESYESKNAIFTEAVAKYCVESAGMKYTGMDMLKNPMVTGNYLFSQKFNAVVAQVMTPVAPAVVSEQFMQTAEIKQIGWGETARFIVNSNDLFVVHDVAEGVQLGGVQRLYNNEITINPSPKQVRIDSPWLTK